MLDSKSQKYKARLFIEPRSLIIFTEDFYKKYYHGIEECAEDIIYNPKCLNEENMHLQTNNLELTDVKIDEA